MRGSIHFNFIEDFFGYRCSLNYIRDKDGREVDFAVSINGTLEYLIEVKLTDENISSSLKYYTAKLKPRKSVQLVGNLTRSYSQGDILVAHPIEFFTEMDPAPWNVKGVRKWHQYLFRHSHPLGKEA